MMGEGNGNALVVAVYAAVVYDIISATNSSPQTTEINASVRADTLMKWVHIGLAQAMLFVVIGMYLRRMENKSAWSPLLGGGLAGVLLYYQYCHAKKAGIEKGGQGTEVYGGTG